LRRRDAEHDARVGLASNLSRAAFVERRGAAVNICHACIVEQVAPLFAGIVHLRLRRTKHVLAEQSELAIEKLRSRSYCGGG
jgi:hypothetical protein